MSNEGYVLGTFAVVPVINASAHSGVYKSVFDTSVVRAIDVFIYTCQ